MQEFGKLDSHLEKRYDAGLTVRKGLGQTAARLQRDWGQPNPDALPFANSIKPHALVVLLQKGLRLHEYESSIDQARRATSTRSRARVESSNRVGQHGNRKSPVPFFGHPTTNPVALPKLDLEGSTSPARRAGVEGLTNGIAHDAASQPPPAKRSRRNGGPAASSAGATSKARSSDAMELDHPSNGVLHANDASAAASAATAAAKREAAATHSPAAASAGAGAAGTAAPCAPSRDTTEMDLDGHPNAKRGPPTTTIATLTTTTDADPSRLAPHVERPLVNGDSSERDVRDASDPASSQSHAAPGSAHAALPPPIPTLASGRSVGMQSDQVADLRPETAVLDAPGTDVTHLHWNPRDPTRLAAGGDTLCRIWTLPTAAASPDPARSGLASAEASPVPPPPPSAPGSAGPNGAHHHGPNGTAGPSAAAATVDAFDLPEVVSEDALVTALAWSPDGRRLAVALHPKAAAARGTILILSAAGETLDALPGAQDWVLSLTWNPAGALLLGAAHAAGAPGSTLMVWDVAGGRAVEPRPMPATVHAAAWIEDDYFAVCGPGALSLLLVRGLGPAFGGARGIVQHEHIPAAAEPARAWSAMARDPLFPSCVAVAAAASGHLGLLDLNGDFHAVAAHPHDVTALRYQPRVHPPPPAPPATHDFAPHLLATASTDGTVKLWDAAWCGPPQLLRTLRLGAAEPALALAFAPDGARLAAAGRRTLRVWDPAAGEPPRASWTAGPDFAVRRARSPAAIKPNGAAANGDHAMGEAGAEEAEDEGGDMSRSLSWDAEGKRVALGAMDQVSLFCRSVGAARRDGADGATQIAIISFRR